MISLSAIFLTPLISLYSFSHYSADTLDISVSPKEIQRKNTWRAHAQPFDKFLTVSAFSNKKNGKYQCTELVHRFLKEEFGIPTRIGMGLGHANTVVNGIFKTFGSNKYFRKDQALQMSLFSNEKATEPPAVGSPINFSSGKYGHVAITRYVEKIKPDRVRVYLFEQHGFPKWKVGAEKPLRFIEFRKNKFSKWVSSHKEGIGQPLNWINFKKL